MQSILILCHNLHASFPSKSDPLIEIPSTRNLGIDIAQRTGRGGKELVTREPVLARRRRDIEPLRVRRLAARAVGVLPVRSACGVEC